MENLSEQAKRKMRYDATCKEVLSEKSMIACILQTCVEEFKGCSIKDIARHYIQGMPEVGTVVVEPDDGGALRIRNEQTEDKTQQEGTVFYDIRFTAIAPDSNKLIKLIINIEAQNDFHPGYPLLKRAIFYCSRLISSQYGTIFTKAHYEKIQKVYSIWICTEPTKKWSYSITRYRMTEERIEGHGKAREADYDLLTPILVCLGKKRYTELHGLLKMLNMVLLDDVKVEDKLQTLSQEFGIEVTPHLEKGVAKMCNLSEGIEKRGFNKGKVETILEMLKDNLALPKIVLYTKMPIDVIRKIAKDNNLPIREG